VSIATKEGLGQLTVQQTVFYRVSVCCKNTSSQRGFHVDNTDGKRYAKISAREAITRKSNVRLDLKVANVTLGSVCMKAVNKTLGLIFMKIFTRQIVTTEDAKNTKEASKMNIDFI